MKVNKSIRMIIILLIILVGMFTISYAKPNQSIIAKFEDSTHKHTYTVFVLKVFPNCTTKGYSVYSCSRCDATIKKAYTKALGHDYSRFVLGVFPSCITQGYNVYGCSRCDVTIKKDYTKKTNHKDVNNDKKCDVCRTKVK